MLPEETVSEASEQTERAELTENTELTDPTEPTEPTEAPYEDPGEDDMELLAEADNAIMLAASITSNVLLFDQASPNYTTYLSSQISVTYKPNGTDSSKTAYIKNLGWHFARINGVSYPDDPIYCIEPCKNYAASTSGNYVDNDVTVDGSGSTRGSNVWYAMPESYREAIPQNFSDSGDWFRGAGTVYWQRGRTHRRRLCRCTDRGRNGTVPF